MPSNIPPDVIEIKLINNEIKTFPDDAFDKFYQLKRLYLGKNPIKAIPNLIPVGDTLARLNIPHCHITHIDESIFNELKVLQSVNLEGSRLTSFPNVPGPGNSLVRIIISDCQLSKFPAVNHYKTLEELDVTNNPMTSVQDPDVDSLERLNKLIMRNVTLRVLPYNPKALRTVGFIDISSSDVSTNGNRSLSTFTRLSLAQYSLALQHRGLKHQPYYLM